MTTLAGPAYAKINIALHLRRRRADGYHDLETLFAFADIGDRLDVAPAPTLSLDVEGPFADGLATEDNLVMKAARILSAEYKAGQGAHIRLQKHIPVAAGLGGGSADAAAALRLLNRFWSLGLSDQELEGHAAGLGADVPACVRSITVRGEGTGTTLVPYRGPSLSETPVLLVNPGVQLQSGEVFAAWDGRDLGALEALPGRNDLEQPAIHLCPEIADVLSFLRARRGVSLVRMSGSGPTCFALFEREADAMRAQAEVPAVWWQARGKLL